MSVTQAMQELNQSLEGEIHYDELHKRAYATDASVYRKIPLAVAYPKNKSDLVKLVAFASKKKISLTPRTAEPAVYSQC